MKSIGRRIREQADRTPDAVASRDATGTMSYRSLELSSDQLAMGLIDRGVLPGDRVGLTVDRGLALPVAILGILKTGAAYVPLDPSYPAPRLHFMIQDSAPRLIVSDSRHVKSLGTDVPCATPRSLQGEGEALGSSEPVDLIRPHRAAYLIYTSGSTGKPKGVVLPHRALDNLINWQLEQVGFTVPGTTLQFSPVSFDAHYHELFSTLPGGGTMVHVEESLRLDPFRLLPFMSDQGVERLFLPFVALQQLAEVGVSFDLIPSHLKQVVTAGERLQVTDTIREFFRRIPDCRLNNHYGPSETHVVTAHPLEADPTNWPDQPPIGKPIANVGIHVVNDRLEDLPPGEAGELCFTGPCLADGYWGRDDLTAERFVPAPGSDELMYRTGDLGRILEDGVIEFHGRMDDQVKIRGFRVELGEVETAIMRHPAVAECAVTAAADASGVVSLTGFLVLDARRPLAAGGNAPDGLNLKAVEEWQSVWETTYEGAAQEADEDLATEWRSSFDRKPLPKADMGAWADATVQRILAENPRRVLEVGCGGGLILSRLAPHLEAYTGVDFSATAIEALRYRYRDRPPCPEFALDVAAAHDLSRFEPGFFDTVVMNSVTQHFPDTEYLQAVIASILRLIPSGQAFLGDITNYRLRDAFWTAVEAYRAKDDLHPDALRGRVERSIGSQRELLIDPDFFHRLPELHPTVSSVETQLKTGAYRNELSDFRFDTWIKNGGPRVPPLSAEEVQWGEGIVDVAALEARLVQGLSGPLAILGIPNERVQSSVIGGKLLRGRSFSTLAEWRAATEAEVQPALDPERFWEIQDRFACRVTVDCSGDPASFDVLVCPEGTDPGRWERRPKSADRGLETLTTNPRNPAMFPSVEKAILNHLDENLPEYMIPQAFVLMDSLPRMPSGKLARSRLSLPPKRKARRTGDGSPPSGAMEEKLARIWEEVLGVEGVGAEDSFFDLGGNSILIVKLVVALRKQMARELPLVMLFEHPTIRSLAAHFQADEIDKGPTETDSRDRAARQRRAFSKTKDNRRRT